MNPTKRSLFVDGRWLAQPGQGTYTYFHEIYTRLVQRQVPELELIFGLLPGHHPDFLPPDAIILEYKSDGFLWRQLRLARDINRLQPDFVHFQYMLPLGLDRRIHSIVALHDVIFLEHPEFFPLSYRLLRKLFFGTSARKADSLLTISDKSAQDITKHFGISSECIDVIPLGIGSRLAHVHATEVVELTGRRFLLTVGRHEPRKNYQRLMQAFVTSKLFETQGAQLVIAGWLVPEFSHSAEILPPGVVLLTDCSDSQLAWLYKHAQGFIFPSIAEGYGLPLVEALEFGVTSAASTTYPIDVVREACIMLFDPYSVDQISASLLALANSPRCPAPAATSLSTWEDYVDRFIDLVLRMPRKRHG
jgi:glycosyltransferase involved in cell wall biosynthesis